MRTTILGTLGVALVLSACGGVPDAGQGEAAAEVEQASTGGGGAVLKPPPPQFVFLNVTQVEPALPVEGRPVYVHFTLDNQTTKTTSGIVQADVTRQDGSVVKSTPWQVAVPAGKTGQGILEFDAPYAGPAVAYTPHFYPTSSTTPGESNATASTTQVAIRARERPRSVAVIAAADSFLGDSDVAYVQLMKDGALTFAAAEGLGNLHAGTGAWIDPRGPAVDVVPGTTSVGSYTTRVAATPYNWGGGPVHSFTVASKTVDLGGDSARAWVSDSTYALDSGDACPAIGLDPMQVFSTHHCGGVETTGSCYPGQTDYWLEHWVERILRNTDTIPLHTYVAQIRADQSFYLWLGDVGGCSLVTVQKASGDGSLQMEAFVNSLQNDYLYIPPTPAPTEPMLVKLVATDLRNRTATIYLEVRPTNWGF